MRRQRRSGLVVGLVASVLGGLAWALYRRREHDRQTGVEALEDPGVSEAFGKMARMPQMRLIRLYVARKAASLVGEGVAADLGCGPAHLLVEMTRQSFSLRVIGVDMSCEMLAQAGDNTVLEGVQHRTAFGAGDVSHLPFADDSLDLVVSTLSLHHWHNPVTVLDEVKRILKPSGSFLVFDLRRDMRLLVWLVLWFVTRVVGPPALRRANEPLGSRDAAYTPDELAEIAAASELSGWRIGTGPFWLTLEGSVDNGPTSRSTIEVGHQS